MMHKEEIKKNIKLNAVKSVKKKVINISLGFYRLCFDSRSEKESRSFREVRKKFDYMLIKVQFLPVLLYTKKW